MSEDVPRQTRAQALTEGVGLYGGQDWTTDDGEYAPDIWEEHAVAVHVKGEGSGGKRYIFEDESVITSFDGGWDFGYTDCWCWRGHGHSDDCTEV